VVGSGVQRREFVRKVLRIVRTPEALARRHLHREVTSS
jgi:hypothetical protein